jgi:tRNA A-37 threonylcarbamoyl transferase component Bud32
VLASLPLPTVRGVRKSVEVLDFAAAAPGATVVFHPRFASWLRKVGLDSAPAILGLRGEIVCGHADRHVVRVVLPGGRTLYLKREHTVGRTVRFKNWRAGFGAVSRSEREAMTLQLLEAEGLPAPQWLAYGSGGDGRSFLLVDGLAGAKDLPARLSDGVLSPADADRVATRAGAALAELHDAGFATPDLAAKHVYLAGPLDAPTLLDWQSAPVPGPVAWADRVAALTKLHASLPARLAPRRLRFAFLRSYLRSCAGPSPAASDAARRVVTATRSRSRRNSSHDQRQSGDPVRLVWVDDERAVCLASLAKHWPSALADADAGQLTESRSFDPIGRAVAHVRGVPWRSPAARSAQMLAQLQRAGVAAPRLLAYGQTLGRFASAKCFLLTDRPSDAEPLSAKHAEGPGRAAVLAACGTLLRSLHDAGVRGQRTAPNVLLHSRVAGLLADAPAAFVRTKRVGFAALLRDLRSIVRAVGPAVSDADRHTLVSAYCAAPLPGMTPARVLARLAREVRP